MGTIILIIAIVTEITFVIYSLVTRGRHEKIRSAIWLVALLAFALFTLVSVIQWGFRWYLLAGLLFIGTVVSAVRLLRNKPAAKAFSAVRAVLGSIGILLLVLIALIPAFIFPQTKLPPPTGKYEVSTVKYTYTDENRVESFTNTGEKRKVNLEFWYPKAAGGTYPLVVFSHGTGGIKSSNTSAFTNLASNGYVVCSIDHPYHSLFTTGADGKLVRIDAGYWQEYMDAVNNKYNDDQVYQLINKWLDLRTADMNFVLNSILSQLKDSQSGEVYRLIDSTKIGLMGHSIGGAESVQVARTRSDISAVIDLDGEVYGDYQGIVNGKPVLNNAPFNLPFLAVYCDDMVQSMASNNVPAIKQILAGSPMAFEIYLNGTNHFSVTDLALVSPFIVSMMTSAVPGAAGGGADPYQTIEKTNDIILHFFNVYLKGEGKFSVAAYQ